MPENLILIPGMLCNAELYTPQIEFFDARYDVTVADHTGLGDMGEIAERILATAPERFSLAGLSMGGFISFEILRRAPERVERLALLDTAARAPREDQKDQHRFFNAMAEKDGMTPVLDVVVPVCLYPARINDEKLVGAVRSMMEKTGVENFVHQQNAIIERQDARADLGAITCPTVVIVGAEDAVTPPKLSEEIVDGIAGAKLEIIPECGHIATLERPDAVNAVLANWLEG